MEIFIKSQIKNHSNFLKLNDDSNEDNYLNFILFNPFGEREQKRMYLSPLDDTGEEVYPWVYYLLGIDNRQYATYYGGQTSDNGKHMIIDNGKLIKKRHENSDNYTIGNCQFSIINCQLIYEALGDTMLDTLGVTRQGYIGKEKDIENSLGDHGVRKYDYETGRFNSIDPLWEKYYGWTPYQYCGNKINCEILCH